MTALELLCAEMGTYYHTALYWRIIFISIRLQTYAKIFRSKSAIFNIFISFTNLFFFYIPNAPSIIITIIIIPHLSLGVKIEH